MKMHVIYGKCTVYVEVAAWEANLNYNLSQELWLGELETFTQEQCRVDYTQEISKWWTVI